MAGRYAFLCNKSGKTPLAWYLPAFLTIFGLAVFVLASQSTTFAQANAESKSKAVKAQPMSPASSDQKSADDESTRPEDKPFKGMKYRLIGPFRGGRSLTAAGIPGDPTTYYFGATGGGVAVPIFEPVIRAVWNEVAPRTALAPPSPEAKRDLMCTSVDADSAEVKRRGTTNISECLRIDVKGRVIDTRMALLEPGASRGSKNRQDDEESPRKKMALRERHHRYASERLPQARQIAPQGGFFGGGGFGGGGWFGSAGQYGGGSWGR